VIILSRLNGQIVAINPDLITWIDVTPDTTLSLLGGDHIIVRESLDDVIAKVIEFRRAVGVPGLPRYEAVLERMEPSSKPPRSHSSTPRR
jgi:flagellar protein FlbD